MNELTKIDTLPNNVEAEQQLIGAVLVNNDNFHRVSHLTADDFFDPVHGRIWDICRARIMRDHLVSPVALAPLMAEDEGLAELGGAKYLARLAGAAINSSAAPHYAELILEVKARRDMQYAIREAQTDLVGGGDLPEIQARLEAALMALPTTTDNERSVSYLAAMTTAIEEAMEAYQGDREGLTTGITALDDMIGGLCPGDLFLLGGATSMGKTSVGLEIARHVADQGVGVAVVSLEMLPQQLVTRLLSSASGVAYTDIRRGKMEEDQARLMIEKARDQEARQIEIIKQNVKDIAAIFAACKATQAKMKDGHPLGLIVVDYAQLIRAPGKSRYEQQTAVSIGLKGLAMQLGLPVIALCQLSRDIVNRDDKRPRLSDLKESGQFENDADFAIFCHRESYYLRREGPPKGKDGTVSAEVRADFEAALAKTDKVIELFVRKNRHGPIGRVRAGFDEKLNRIWDLETQGQFEDF